ncbi:hypothetical protein NK8_63410 (plasmid) [Caballeronia sp. NK8]|nr:hypothetical protein NK8_63410 [Caballeronia sp. NK8]
MAGTGGKLWVEDAGYERARVAIDKSLKRLGLDYLDLFLMYQPFSDSHGAWKAMEEAHRAGRLRAIGLSNFQSCHGYRMLQRGETTHQSDRSHSLPTAG